MAFYKTPVNTSVPLDMMRNIDLPKNLHVIYKYTRFHPGMFHSEFPLLCDSPYMTAAETPSITDLTLTSLGKCCLTTLPE